MSESPIFRMAQTSHLQGFAMDFHRYTTNIKQLFRNWDSANTGTPAERVVVCFNAMNQFNIEIIQIQQKMDDLVLSSLAHEDIIWLMGEYAIVLNLLNAMHGWFESSHEDYEDIVEALLNGDFETAAEIQAGLDMESGNYGFLE